jgi:nitroreductase
VGQAAHYRDMLKSPAFNIFYDARTLVVIGVGEGGTYTDADCWLAAENFMLAACDAGLGSCCIGFAIPVLNTSEAKAELGLPAAGVAVAPILLGYPAAAPPPIPRSDPKIVSWSR